MIVSIQSQSAKVRFRREGFAMNAVSPAAGGQSLRISRPAPSIQSNSAVLRESIRPMRERANIRNASRPATSGHTPPLAQPDDVGIACWCVVSLPLADQELPGPMSYLDTPRCNKSPMKRTLMPTCECDVMSGRLVDAHIMIDRDPRQNVAAVSKESVWLIAIG